MRFGSTLFAGVSIINALMVIITGLKVATTGVTIVTVVDAKRAPELTSTALKVHKVYTVFPPHDTDLYDIMEVSPNATLAQITKSYRDLSRKYHPDKQRRRRQQQQQQQQQRQEDAETETRLQLIQRAYAILSNDSKRLPYHRYGLVDPNLAAFLLLGPRISPNNYYQLLQQQQQQQHSYSSSSSNDRDSTATLFDKLDRELLQLMGYDESAMEVVLMAMGAANNGDGSDDTNPSVALEEHRVRTVAALLLESIRPVVEGRLDARLYAHSLAQDCDRWKRLPLGAQIIRSVGRAYRHEGSEFLQRYRNNVNTNNNSWDNSKDENINMKSSSKQMVLQLQTGLTIGFRRKWRSTKDFLEAAAVSGRLAMAERSFNGQEKKRKQQQEQEQAKKKVETYETIEYHEDKEEQEHEHESSSSSSYLPQMDDYNGDDDYESMEELEEKHRESEKFKAQQTLLQALQIEALWKVCKIDLDRIVRRACAMILSGEYFFFPSHQSLEYYDSMNNGATTTTTTSGWVTSSGTTIDSEHARVAAAEAMVMTGDIMVQQSKEGTSWKE